MWKAEKRMIEVDSINQVEKVVERKLWAAEKVTIPAGSAKLVRVKTKGDQKEVGLVESLPLEVQEGGRKSYFLRMHMTCQEVYN